MATRKEKEDWVIKCDKTKGKGRLDDEVWQRERKRKTGWWSVAKRKEKEDWVMKCGNENGKGRLGDKVWQRERKGRLGDEVWQRERKRKIGWWSVAKRKEKEDWVMMCGNEKGKERLGD